MTTFDPESRLRDALRREAESVTPAGDGLAKIQARIATRRARARWLRPAIAVGAAAVVAGAAVGIAALTGNDHGKQSIDVATAPPTSASVAPTTPAPSLAFPDGVVWPFGSAAEAKTWQEQYAANGAQPWHLDAVETATSFVNGYLGMTQLDRVTAKQVGNDTADVSLGRQLPSESHALMTATTVHLVRWGTGKDAPWLVTGASEQYLKVQAPPAGDLVTSPVTVTGPGFGVDEMLTVTLRSLHAPAALGQGHTGFGNGGPWSVSVRFSTAPDATGALVAWTASAIDGAPARVAVVPVRFSGPAGATTYPSTFAGIKDSRVAVFSSRDGAALRWLTAPQPGGGASDPQVTADGKWVYYLQGTGTCANALMRVPYAGGTPERVVALKGAVVSGYGVALGGQRLAYVSQSCGSGGWKLVARDTAAGRTNTLTAPTPPPGWVGDLAWSPDGVHVATIVRTGMLQGDQVYDVWHDTGVMDGTSACGNRPGGGQPTAVAYRTDGTLLMYAGDGTSSAVYTCAGGTMTQLFTVAAGQAGDLSVSADGAVLVTTAADGAAWRWNGGTPVQLHPAKPLADARW